MDGKPRRSNGLVRPILAPAEMCDRIIAANRGDRGSEVDIRSLVKVLP
jgi:hypothetical protein